MLSTTNHFVLDYPTAKAMLLHEKLEQDTQMRDFCTKHLTCFPWSLITDRYSGYMGDCAEGLSERR